RNPVKAEREALVSETVPRRFSLSSLRSIWAGDGAAGFEKTKVFGTSCALGYRYWVTSEREHTAAGWTRIAGPNAFVVVAGPPEVKAALVVVARSRSTGTYQDSRHAQGCRGGPGRPASRGTRAAI